MKKLIIVSLVTLSFSVPALAEQSKIMMDHIQLVGPRVADYEVALRSTFENHRENLKEWVQLKTIELKLQSIQRRERDIRSPDSSLRNKDDARKINDDLYTAKVKLTKVDKEAVKNSKDQELKDLLNSNQQLLAVLEKVYIDEIKGKFNDEAGDSPVVAEHSSKPLPDMIKSKPLFEKGELEKILDDIKADRAE